MLRKIVYGGISILFAVIGILLIMYLVRPRIIASYPEAYMPILIGGTVVLAVIGLLLAPRLVRRLEKTTEKLVARLSSMSTSDIVGCVIGLIVGLVIASLIGSVVARIHIIGIYLAIICILLFGYIGLMVGYRKSLDIWQIFSKDKGEKKERAAKEKAKAAIPPKILDTSVIIDGRIADICHTGFVEGDLVIANFVLEELRHIADSGDSLKRNRGRGGLDVLNRMREEFAERVVITEKDYPQIAEVDSKLLKLAQDLNGAVLTNDFNLNKVAQLQGVRVLNINELSNAVKPIVLPGEEMAAHIIKEGKEAAQGIAYLDDGTMIVVESGKRYIGLHIQVVVTSILQTAAGRMVFARPKYGKNGEVLEMQEEAAI